MFFICPVRPPEYWDELFGLVKQICDSISKAMGVPIRCRRAVDIVSAGIIHPEIWQDIRSAERCQSNASVTNRDKSPSFSNCAHSLQGASTTGERSTTLAANYAYEGAAANEEAFEAVKLAYDADDYVYTVSHGAALRGSPDIIKFLADKGADL